jgi:hypothetical protein
VVVLFFAMGGKNRGTVAARLGFERKTRKQGVNTDNQQQMNEQAHKLNISSY